MLQTRVLRHQTLQRIIQNIQLITKNKQNKNSVNNYFKNNFENAHFKRFHTSSPSGLEKIEWDVLDDGEQMEKMKINIMHRKSIGDVDKVVSGLKNNLNLKNNCYCAWNL